MLLAPLLVVASCGTEASGSSATGIEDVALEHLAHPIPSVYTAGQPTEHQFRELVRRGYKHYVCLRAHNERGTGWEEARAKQLGVRFVRIEITGPQSLTENNVRKVSEALSGSGTAPTLLYCRSSNRVGAVLAMRAHLDGKSADEAIQLGKQAGLTSLETAVREAIRR